MHKVSVVAAGGYFLTLKYQTLSGGIVFSLTVLDVSEGLAWSLPVSLLRGSCSLVGPGRACRLERLAVCVS